MKTKEFIKRVEELGYKVHITNYAIYSENNGNLLWMIYKKKQYKLEIFDLTTEKNAKELFDLCVEYAKTPIEEREEKFYLQKMESFYDDGYDESRAFLNLDTSIDVFRVTTMSETSIFKTQFTQKEIDKIKEEQHTDLSEFKQIPVEEIENEI